MEGFTVLAASKELLKMQLVILHTLSAMWMRHVTASFTKFICVWTLRPLASSNALCSLKADVGPKLSSQLSNPSILEAVYV